ncbi:MAG: hypothetical protein FJZ16_02475 [Candidatus Omnitrophica bacterium]|nr:hypothetical protein [Candidatus Omnitrophota bacterium]
MPKYKPTPDFSKITSHELAYIAGLVDGEGSFYFWKSSIKSGRTKPYPILRITNSHIGVLKWLLKKIPSSRLDNHVKGKNIPTFNWVLGQQKAVYYFTKLLLPYLIIKKEDALKTIKYIYKIVIRSDQ